MELKVENLTKRYGGKTVLDGVSFTLRQGVTCLMAPSGAGKTTLLRLLLGLEKADGGQITGLAGRRVGTVFQEDRLLVDAGRIPSKQLVAALRSGEVQNLPPQLGEAIDEARQVLSATRDPQLGDMVLDRRYFQELLVLAEETGSLFLQGYVQRMIDAANLRTAVRVLRMGQGTEFLEGILFPGGNMEVERLLTGINGGSMLEELYASSPLARAAESGAMAARGGSLTQFEKDCDDAVLDEVRRAQFVAFGEAPVIAYLAAKEAEILAIRIILTGRLADLAPDIIRERLREAYV